RIRGRASFAAHAAILLVPVVAAAQTTASSPAGAYRDSIPGTVGSWELVPVPGGTVTLYGEVVEVAPFQMSRTEVTWDMYDVYVLRLDEPGNAAADAVARPSNPYAVPDYEWGHAGYAAISIAYH